MSVAVSALGNVIVLVAKLVVKLYWRSAFLYTISISKSSLLFVGSPYWKSVTKPVVSVKLV